MMAAVEMAEARAKARAVVDVGGVGKAAGMAVRLVAARARRRGWMRQGRRRGRTRGRRGKWCGWQGHRGGRHDDTS